MHEPNLISLAARASDEPVFREVGVGPWNETHPGEPRPDDPSSPNHDARYDAELLDDGDRRNVLDRYRYWTVEAIRADLDARGRHGFDVAVENWTHDFNIGSMVRTANAFAASHVYIVGPHKWNRKGALMTELYQHVEHRATIEDLITRWRAGIAAEIAALEAWLPAVAPTTVASAGASPDVSSDRPVTDVSSSDASSMDTSVDGPMPDASPDAPSDGVAAVRSAVMERLRVLRGAKVIALDIIPGAVPIETYRFPERCLMLFGAEGPGLSEKAVSMADDVVYISQFGSVRSINAGAAAAVAMHCWIAQHAVVAV